VAKFWQLKINKGEKIMAKSLVILAIEGALTYTDLRYFALLDGLLSSQTFTFSGSTLTTAAPHKLVPNSRFRGTSTGVLPTPLVANTDYFVLTTPSTTTLTVSATLGGSAISLSAGSGIHTMVEQQLSAEDSIAVLVNHELSHANYSRSSVNLSSWSASITNNDARSTDVTRTLSPVSPNGSLSYRHILLIRNGTTTIGNTTGDRHELDTESAIQTIAQGSTKNIVIRRRRSNG
jgi:hypothetical protein